MNIGGSSISTAFAGTLSPSFFIPRCKELPSMPKRGQTVSVWHENRTPFLKIFFPKQCLRHHNGLVSQRPSYSSHPTAGLFILSFFCVGGIFSLVTQHASVLEGGECADSTHRSSCKSLFYGPCNDPPVGNLHSVALQIEPAASCAEMRWRGAGGSREPENAHTHIFQARVIGPDPLKKRKEKKKSFIHMHVFSHPI